MFYKEMKKNYTNLKPLIRIDLTSMIDIIFILLMFFMLSYKTTKKNNSTNTNYRGYKIDLPKDKKATSLFLKDKQLLIININKNNKLLLNGKLITINKLKEKLKKQKHPIPDLIINAHKNTKLQILVSLFDIIKNSGINKSPIIQTEKIKNEKKIIKIIKK